VGGSKINICPGSTTWDCIQVWTFFQSILRGVSGNSVDWAYTNKSIKYSWALELRPATKNKGVGFLLPPSEIKPTVEETSDGITDMAETIYQEF